MDSSEDHEEPNPDRRGVDQEDDGYYRSEDEIMKAKLNETFDPDRVRPSEIVPEKPRFGRPLVKPKIKPSKNTGPKGVIEDYKQAKACQMDRMEQERIKQQQAIKAMSFTVDDQNKGSHSEDEFDDLENDEIFQAIREARLKEFQKLSSNQLEQITDLVKSELTKRKEFGFYQRLTQEEYVDFIDSEPPEVFVVVHIYQTSIPSCMKIHGCLEELAKRYPTTKFGKILSTDAHAQLEEIPDDGLPILVIYKASECLHQFPRVQDELRHSTSFDVDDLEKLLCDIGVLDKKDAVRGYEF